MKRSTLALAAIALLTMGVGTLGSVLVLTNLALGSFPSAAAPNTGGLLFDTTNLVPRYSDGTVWAPISQAPPGFISGLLPSYTSTTTITVGTGRARSSDGLTDIILASPVVADITASGANGLDTGSPAATSFYFVFVIADSTGVSSPATLLSLSSTAPTLPGGYNRFRRVGTVRCNTVSVFVKFQTVGAANRRVSLYTDSINNRNVLAAGSSTTAASVALGSVIPPTSRYAYIKFRIGAQFLTLYADPADSASPFDVIFPNQEVTSPIPTTSSQTIGYAVSSSNTAYIWCLGYEEDV